MQMLALLVQSFGCMMITCVNFTPNSHLLFHIAPKWRWTFERQYSCHQDTSQIKVLTPISPLYSQYFYSHFGTQKEFILDNYLVEERWLPTDTSGYAYNTVYHWDPQRACVGKNNGKIWEAESLITCFLQFYKWSEEFWHLAS